MPFLQLSFVITAIELVSSVRQAPVALISDEQRAVLRKETLAERKALFAERLRENGNSQIVDGSWRKSTPIRFVW